MDETVKTDWIRSADFEGAFTEHIASDAFFEIVENKLSSGKGWLNYVERFPDALPTPFRKELRKWISKVAPYRIKSRSKKSPPKQRSEDPLPFHGTLKNLEIYCKLTGKTPNQVLGVSENSNREIKFLSKEDISTICYILKQNSEKFINIDWPVLLPVIYHVDSLTMVYLKIYKARPNNPFFSIQFLTCDLNRATLHKENDYIIFQNAPTDERPSSSSSFFADIDFDYDWAEDNLHEFECYSRRLPTFANEQNPGFAAIIDECLNDEELALSGSLFDVFSIDEIYYGDDVDEKLDRAAKAKQAVQKKNHCP